MKNIVFIISIFLVITACTHSDDYYANKEIEKLNQSYPKCVVDKIKSIYQAEFHGNNTVKKYSYNGQMVYDFEYDSTVLGGEGYASSIINENCETICGIDSGIIYHNTCIDFDRATFIETVWKDPRNK